MRSGGVVQLPALLAEAFEAQSLGHHGVTTLLANEPAFRSWQHGPEMIAQNAVGTANDLLSHFEPSAP
jgi:hypothetical protein